MTIAIEHAELICTTVLIITKSILISTHATNTTDLDVKLTLALAVLHFSYIFQFVFIPASTRRLQTLLEHIMTLFLGLLWLVSVAVSVSHPVYPTLHCRHNPEEVDNPLACEMFVTGMAFSVLMVILCGLKAVVGKWNRGRLMMMHHR